MATTFLRKGNNVLISINGQNYSVPATAVIKPDTDNSNIIVISERFWGANSSDGILIAVDDVPGITFANRNELIEKLSSDFFFRSVIQTPEGGIAVAMINKTGAVSVKGTIVTAGTVDNSVVTSAAGGMKPIGAIYNSGVADGAMVYVVFSGIGEVLLQDNSAATAGYWVRTSDTQAGRADASNEFPQGGTIQALEDHSQEIGHCVETVSAGTDKMAKIIMHFN